MNTVAIQYPHVRPTAIHESRYSIHARCDLHQYVDMERPGRQLLPHVGVVYHEKVGNATEKWGKIEKMEQNS